MLSLEKINETIIELERSDTSFAVVDKLADCYIVRDHLIEQQPKPKTGKMSGSEFLQIASGVDVSALLSIIAEHLEALRVVHPAEYAEIIRRITVLHNA